MPVEIGSAEDMLRLYNQNQPPAGITTTIDQWLKWTDLGVLSRRDDQIRAIDDALRAYHLAGGSDGAFLRLQSAFNQWISVQLRQGKNWKKDPRNLKFDAMTDLFNQINLVNANRTPGAGRPPEQIEAIQYIIEAEKNSIERLFNERTMLFKNVVKEASTKRKEQLKGAVKAVASPAGKIARAGREMATTSMHLSSPDSVRLACTQILGSTPPDALFHMLGEHSLSAFCTAASGLFGMVASPGKLLVDIVKAGMAASTRYTVSGARYNFRAGAADASVTAVIRMIDDELAAIAIDAAKQTGSIVAAAFGAGPIASAASAVVDLMVNLKAYRAMLNEIEAANRALTHKTFSLELFNISPVLGCYYLLMADTSVWINFPMQDIGYAGWKEDVMLMRNRAEPVREKARELIRKSKICLSGTEFYNGIEWEPTWRNNKREFFASGQALVTAKRKMQGKGSGPHHDKPAAADIWGQGPGGRGLAANT